MECLTLPQLKGEGIMQTLSLCSMCETISTEEELVLFEDVEGYGKGCPKCKTDKYLGDVEGYLLGVHNTRTDEMMSTTHCIDYDHSIELVAEHINAHGWDLAECRIYEGELTDRTAANLYIVEELLSYIKRSDK